MGLSTLDILGSVWKFSGVNAKGSFLALSTHPFSEQNSKFMSVRRRNLWAFDVEISERLTLKAQSVRRRNLRAFDVERFL